MVKRLLKLTSALAILSFLLTGLPAPQAHAAGLCYVDPTSTSGLDDGSSWANGYLYLQFALGNPGCTEIWVKAGYYFPGFSQTSTFGIPAGVALYGGFAGTETMRSQRNPAVNLTILTGDIDLNDVNLDGNRVDETTADIRGNNAYHVVTFDGVSTSVTSSTVLDGFTITGGEATTGSFPNNTGGGIFCRSSTLGHQCSPTLANLTFSGNLANNAGAIFASGEAGGNGSPSLTNVTFSGNAATLDGGAIYSFSNSGTSSPILTDVTFSGNSAAQNGGAMYNSAEGGTSGPTLTNVTFSGNTAVGDGGAMFNSATFSGQVNPVIANVTFNGNSAMDGGAIYSIAASGSSSSPGVTNTILWGDSASTSGPEVFNVSATPVFLTSVVQGSGGSGVSWDTSLGADNGGNIDADPMLGSLAHNGGSTQTIALGAGSSAIDAADFELCPATDQRGRPRNADGDHDGSEAPAVCDIGAFEVPTFADLPVAGQEWMEPWINAFYNAGVTTGCGVSPVIYCPENNVTREEMAVFLLRAIHGLGYTPPNVTGIFADMPVAGKEWMEPWVDEFYNEGITTGCGTNPLIFCPTNDVTREEMAVFILRAVHGSSYTPPNVTGIFADMPVTGKEWMEPWVDEFYNEGITTGCGVSPLIYCPSNNVTRAEMAVFIDRAFHLYP